MSAPLYEQLFQYVIREIRSGNLKVGDRVPSEKALAEQFNVSRITSKKALELLHQAGIIDRMQGKGSFVAAIPAADGIHEPDSHPGRRTGLIGVVLPDFSDVYALKLIHAIEEACAAARLYVVVKRTYGSQTVEKEAIQTLVGLGVAGLIIFPVHGEYYNSELLRLVLSGFPVVLVDRYLKGIPASSVGTDNVRASHQLTRYLLDKGHEHIAFISPPAENTSTIEERLEGYRAALNESGLNGSAEHVLTTLYATLPTAFNAEHIARDTETLRAYLSAHPHITAFVVCEFNLAVLLHEALQSLNLMREIVCFDSPDIPIYPLPFTHIRQNEAQMGRTAVDMLLAQLNGDTTTQTVNVPFSFVEVTESSSKQT